MKKVPSDPKYHKERFESKYIKLDSECWEWTAHIDAWGYGTFKRDKQYLAHRFSYMLYVGEIQDGLCVLHRCDNRKCVNPLHLFLGTKKQNILDMYFKGRDKYISKKYKSAVGIYFKKNIIKTPWRATIRKDNKMLSIGNYATEQLAIDARNKYISDNNLNVYRNIVL